MGRVVVFQAPIFRGKLALAVGFRGKLREILYLVDVVIPLGCPGTEVIGSMVRKWVISPTYKWGIPWGEKSHWSDHHWSVLPTGHPSSQCSTWRNNESSTSWGSHHATVLSMVVSGSLKRWDRWHSPSPNWQEKCHLYTTYSPCLLGGYIIPTTF